MGKESLPREAKLGSGQILAEAGSSSQRSEARGCLSGTQGDWRFSRLCSEASSCSPAFAS